MRSARSRSDASSPSSSSAAGRSSEISPRSFSISSAMCCCAWRTQSRSASRHAGARARREQHVQPGESLKRLVVELARPARALRLGGLKPPARGLLAGVLRARPPCARARSRRRTRPPLRRAPAARDRVAAEPHREARPVAPQEARIGAALRVRVVQELVARACPPAPRGSSRASRPAAGFANVMRPRSSTW